MLPGAAAFPLPAGGVELLPPVLAGACKLPGPPALGVVVPGNGVPGCWVPDGFGVTVVEERGVAVRTAALGVRVVAALFVGCGSSPEPKPRAA